MISSQTFADNGHQDWQTVVFKKRISKYGQTEKDINAARRQNATVVTSAKTHVNNKSGNSSINTRKVEEETEDFHHKRVPMEVAKAIERARLEKRLTQDALAKSLNMPTRDINEIEKGVAIYNGQLLAKIKHFLGI